MIVLLTDVIFLKEKVMVLKLRKKNDVNYEWKDTLTCDIQYYYSDQKSDINKIKPSY